MTKPIPFLKELWRDDEENGGFLREHSESGRERNGQDNEQSQWAREIWKVFENYPENDPHSAKHAFFAMEWVVNKLPS